MKDPNIIRFEAQTKHILDWSNTDAGTKDILQRLMAEVATLVEEMQSSNGLWSGQR